MKSIYAAIFVAAFVAGCNPATITPVITAPPPISVPVAQPLTLSPLNWVVYNGQDIQALAADIKANPGKKVVLFTLTDGEYKKLNANYIDIERYIGEQREINLYLKAVLDARSSGAEDPPAPELKKVRVKQGQKLRVTS